MTDVVVDELEMMGGPVETDEEWRIRKAKERIDAMRTELLIQTDWYVIRQQETGESVPDNIITYRQELRDITMQPGYPWSVEWPNI